MKGILIVTILTVRSSYLQEVEYPIDAEEDVPDTLQWWISDTSAWRIRTYAMDHDIHTHSLSLADDLQDLVLANTRKHYGDVTLSEHVLELADALEYAQIEAAFKAAGLPPRLEIAADRFLFWKPDDARYRTQSQPE